MTAAPLRLWFLPPGLPDPPHTLTAGLARPGRPGAALLGETVAALEAEAPALAKLPVRRIVAAIDSTLSRWTRDGEPARAAILEHGPAETGFSREALRYALDVILPRFGSAGLLELLRSELGDPELLDGFVGSRIGGRRAHGLGRHLHVFAGSVPTVAIVSMIWALLTKSPLLAKPASGDLLLPALFAQSLAQTDPRLAGALAVMAWPGGDEELEAEALAGAGAVVVYGSDATVASLRRRAPAGARFLGYGHRVSVAAVAREALRRERLAETAAGLAWDVALFDQRGCLSPQAALVERGGEATPAQLCEALAGRLESLSTEFPRGALPPGRAARIRSIREAALFRSTLSDAAGIWQSEGTQWTVLLQSSLEGAASGDRMLTVVPVDSLANDLPRLCAGLPLSTIGLAAPEERTIELLAVLSGLAQRICPAGKMGEPPVTWRHDGRPNLADLLSWVDWEA